MRAPQPPTRFTAGQSLTLFGVRYERGQTIPAAVVGELPHADALLSRRQIIPAPEPTRAQTLAHVPTPTRIAASVQRSLRGL